MGTSSDGKKFLGLDTGNWLTVMLNIVALAYFIGVSNQTLKEHARHLDEHSSELKTLREQESFLAQKGSSLAQQNNAQLAQLELRVFKIENSLAKIDVLANDMEWLKNWLITKNPNLTIPPPTKSSL